MERWSPQVHSGCIMSRLPGCAGQVADAVSVKLRSKWKMLQNYWKFPNRNLQTFGFVYHDEWLKSWSSIEDPVVPLERNLYGHPLAGLLWERQFENILLKYGWEKVSNWECLFVHREKGTPGSHVMQERRIDDCWNIDGSRDLSASWTDFTQFTVVEEKPPDGYMLSGERLTKRQVTSRPDNLWPELRKKLGRNVKLKERH